LVLDSSDGTSVGPVQVGDRDVRDLVADLVRGAVGGIDTSSAGSINGLEFGSGEVSELVEGHGVRGTLGVVLSDLDVVLFEDGESGLLFFGSSVGLAEFSLPGCPERGKLVAGGGVGDDGLDNLLESDDTKSNSDDQ